MNAVIRPRTYPSRDAVTFQQRPAAPRFTGATRYALRDKDLSERAGLVFHVAPADDRIIHIHIEPADEREKSWKLWWDECARKVFERAPTRRRHATAAARLRVGRLAAIQSALGFTTQDLATVLGLSRQQLYRWLDETDEVRMQDAKRRRLAVVERVAKAWQAKSLAPLQYVAHEPLASGGTLFALMSGETIDEAALRVAFDEMIARLHAQPGTLSQRMTDAGFKRRPSVRSLPSDG